MSERRDLDRTDGEGPERHRGNGENGRGHGADRMDFAVTTRRVLQEQIHLADSKAGAVSTVSVLLLAYVVRVGSQDRLPTTDPQLWLLLAGVVALGAGIAAALSVVLPRLVRAPGGLVFWQAILRYRTAEDYARAVVEADLEDIVEALLEDCFRLSNVCERKYAALRWALVAASLGLALTVLWLVLQ